MNLVTIAFLYTNNESLEKETKKTIPFTIAKTTKTPRNKPTKRGKRPGLIKI